MSGPLPPRQVATSRWPLVGERTPEPFDAVTWSLTVGGLVTRPLAFGLAAFAALPHVTREGTLHCVTRWSRPGTALTGVPLATLLDAATPHASARFVRFASGRGHDTTLPLATARAEVLVADAASPEPGAAPAPIPPEHGGPVRAISFERYLYKSVKWLRTIELLDVDRLGHWERTAGYHNGADPWREERYVARDASPAALRAALLARDLSGLDLLGADMTRADLAGFRIVRTSLRNARLAGARLVGADLTGSSLCNADLRGADLRDACIDGIDLDGADLRGADLRGARGVPATLAAVQLTDPANAAAACRIEGLDWSGAELDGVLDADLAHLARAGVAKPGA